MSYKYITINEYCIKTFKDFNYSTMKILTVDRGKEFADYLDLESILKVDIYFADLYSSLQIWTNTNTNCLIIKLSVAFSLTIRQTLKKYIILNILRNYLKLHNYGNNK